MTAHFKLPEQNAIAAQAARLVEAGIEEELVMGVLCKSGLSKIDSMRLMSELTGVPLLVMRKRVEASQAWRPTFARDAAFQARIDEALRALQEDELG